MKEELTEALDSILLQNEVTKQTSAWWSIVGLISILNDQMGEENQFGDVEKRLTRLSFRLVHEFDNLQSRNTGLFNLRDRIFNQAVWLVFLRVEGRERQLKYLPGQVSIDGMPDRERNH